MKNKTTKGIKMHTQKQLWDTNWWKSRSNEYYQNGIEETDEIYADDCEEVLGLLDLANKHIKAGRPNTGMNVLAYDDPDEMLEIAEIEPDKYRDLIPYLESPLPWEELKAIEEENELHISITEANNPERGIEV